MASCDWPDIGSQPLNLEDSWRLRVASAQMFYIVKNRDVQHFDKVVNFLETTHRLLPRLVAPLRHMKLMFGLKTMVRIQPSCFSWCCWHRLHLRDIFWLNRMFCWNSISFNLPEISLKHLLIKSSPFLWIFYKKRLGKNWLRAPSAGSKLYYRWFRWGSVYGEKWSSVCCVCRPQVVMWMLQQGRTVDTMLKINQFFPRELPQYQDQCVSDHLVSLLTLMSPGVCGHQGSHKVSWCWLKQILV